MTRCLIFSDYEDRLLQQTAIMGMLLRGIYKLLSNSKYTDKYIHKKCREFAEMGVQCAEKIDALNGEMREGVIDGEQCCKCNTDNLVDIRELLDLVRRSSSISHKHGVQQRDHLQVHQG